MMGQEQMPAQGGGEAPAEGGGAGELLVNVGKGLEAITNAVGQAEVPDEIKQRLAAVTQEYLSIVDELSGGAGGGQGGAAQVEQTPGARPASPSGM
jgi:hypothetical protein